jgi:hypothetical protein
MESSRQANIESWANMIRQGQDRVFSISDYCLNERSIIDRVTFVSHLDSRFRGNDTTRNLSFPRKRESRLDYYPINLRALIQIIVIMGTATKALAG